MSTAADMLVEPKPISPLDFEIDAVGFGTTKRGKPPRGTVVRDFILFIVTIVGFALLIAGIQDQVRPTRTGTGGNCDSRKNM